MSVSCFARALVSALLVTTSFVAGGSPAVSAQTTDPTVSTQPSDPRFFSQTGFRVDTDAFWSFFQARGGVRTFGATENASPCACGVPRSSP